MNLIVANLLLLQYGQAVTSPVSIPFKIADNAIVVDVTVNGKKTSCMFDTGFSGYFLLNDSLNVGKPSGAMTLKDFVGTFQASTIKLNSVKFGEFNVPVSDAEIVQQPVEHLSESYNTHTDGIMGMAVFKDLVTEINMQNSKFIIHPKGTDITKRVPDGKRTFLARMLPVGHTSIEMTVETSEGKKMTLALDTGNAFFAATHKEVLERVGVWPAGKKPDFMRTSWVGSGPVDSFYTLLTNTKVFGVPVKRSVWSIIDLPSSDSAHDGTIGFGFLKNFNVTIDFERRRVWLELFKENANHEPVADVGISVFYDPRIKRHRIWNVTPGSPAERAGIKRGDDLLGIANNDLLNAGDRVIAELLEGPVGSKVQLAISRGGVLNRIEVERAYLVNNMPRQSG